MQQRIFARRAGNRRSWEGASIVPLGRGGVRFIPCCLHDTSPVWGHLYDDDGIRRVLCCLAAFAHASPRRVVDRTRPCSGARAHHGGPDRAEDLLTHRSQMRCATKYNAWLLLPAAWRLPLTVLEPQGQQQTTMMALCQQNLANAGNWCMSHNRKALRIAAFWGVRTHPPSKELKDVTLQVTRLPRDGHITEQGHTLIYSSLW